MVVMGLVDKRKQKLLILLYLHHSIKMFGKHYLFTFNCVNQMFPAGKQMQLDIHEFDKTNTFLFVYIDYISFNSIKKHVLLKAFNILNKTDGCRENCLNYFFCI